MAADVASDDEAPKLPAGWKVEALLDDGSTVVIGPSYGLVIPRGADLAEEIERMRNRLDHHQRR